MESAVQLNEKKLIFGIPQYEFVLLIVVHVCGFLTFIQNPAINMAICLVAIGCTCLLAFNPYLYLLLPVYMIFYEQIVPFSGVVGYRIYTLIIIASCIFNKKTQITAKNILMYFFFMAYTFGIFYVHNQSVVVTCIINFFFIAVYCDNYMKEAENYKKFFSFFILAIVMSALYGFCGGGKIGQSAMVVNGDYVEYGRFFASFNDPNYLGLMFNIAILANICIKPLNGRICWSALTICYIALLATLSVTAILVNIISLLIYFVFIKKFNVVIIPLVIIGIILSVKMYDYALHNDMGFVTNFAYRIDEKIHQASEGDVDAATTDRTKMIKENLQVLSEKSSFGVLFGGSYISAFGRDKTKFRLASHNEFIDNLLFFGAIGVVIYWLYFVFNLRDTLKKVEEDKNIKDLVVFVKLIYIMYCFTLTIFPDIRLMFLFFL